MSAGVPMEPQQEMMYAAPAEPQRMNISPEMFQKLMAGHPVTEEEIHADAAAMGGAAAPVVEAATAAVDAAADAVGAKKKSKKEKKSKDRTGARRSRPSPGRRRAAAERRRWPFAPWGLLIYRLRCPSLPFAAPSADLRRRDSVDDAAPRSCRPHPAPGPASPRGSLLDGLRGPGERPPRGWGCPSAGEASPRRFLSRRRWRSGGPLYALHPGAKASAKEL
ncbi:unnamed protein product [Prorocentrum cordatum]|uniref:Uncharacterized protein n=1 Tax=Prorocentrum cordatum TaxID=2364126 RepID=A0ABN9Q0R3_9DINO|nr:unnamed protein product [Polarella glacialis]